MRAVDTDVLVRLITRDDTAQAASAESFVAKGAWVSVITLAEAAWMLSRFYGLSTHDLASTIEMLLNHRDLVLHRRPWQGHWNCSEQSQRSVFRIA